MGFSGRNGGYSEMDNVIRAFREGKRRERSGSNVWTDGESLYSYRLPIVGRGKDGVVEALHARCSPSITTSRHIRDAARLADRRVDSLGQDECPTCDGYHHPANKKVCDLCRRIRDGQEAHAEAEAAGLVATSWRKPGALARANLPTMLAPAYRPNDGAEAKYVRSPVVWTVPFAAALLSLTASGADSVPRTTVERALALAAQDADYRLALEAAGDVGASALRGFVTSTAGGDARALAGQLALEVSPC
jgi:hypothetical protein